MYPDECWYDGACVMECPRPGAIRLNHPLAQRVTFKRKATGEDSVEYDRRKSQVASLMQLTGDYAGELLYATMAKFGFANGRFDGFVQAGGMSLWDICAAGLIAVFIWGGSFAASKAVLRELSPTTLLFSRTLVALLLVSAYSAFRGRLRPMPRAEWPFIGLLAFLALVTTQGLQANALLRSTSANTAWLVGLNPIVTALLAYALGTEQLRGKVAGTAIAFGGALLVVSHTFEELSDEEALVRVISAREATAHERAQYERG